MNRELLLSYAHAFLSFLFRARGASGGGIKSVYLFGSVARGDFDEDSDVDIFINTDRNHEKDAIRLSKIALKNFYRSGESGKFRLLGVTNQINVKCGDIKAWKLLDSIKSEGIILHSSSASPLLRKYFLVEIKPVKDAAKRNRIIRKLAGRKEAERKEKGLVEEISGQVLDSRHYIIPAEKISLVTRVLSKENAFFQLKEVWMY